MKVLCNDCECLHYKKLDQPEFIQYTRGINHFEDTGFTGECTREIVGITPHKVETSLAIYNEMRCLTRSDIKLSGHRDFSKLGPQFVDEQSMAKINRDKAVNKTIFGYTKEEAQALSEGT